MSKEKVILAYSGGLDTSVAITWLKKITMLSPFVWMSVKVKILSLSMTKL